jgi:hypothetical protein
VLSISIVIPAPTCGAHAWSIALARSKVRLSPASSGSEERPSRIERRK